MKAMILAAGKGTRVRPLTYTVPKPMIPLIRKPVMESIIEHLASYGVTDFVVNTSHLGPVIENYFRDGDRFGVNIAYSFEGELIDGTIHGKALGSAGGLKKIQDFSGFFDDTFIVLCGDALVDLDLNKVLEFHRARKSLATIVMQDVPRSEVDKYGVVLTDAEGRILRFQEKPSQEEAVSTTINTGIYIFEPGIFEFIPEGVEYDIGGELFPRLVEAGAPFYGVISDFQWLDIGSVPDYWEATQALLKGKVHGYKLPGREIKPGIWAGINLNVDWDKVEILPPVYIGNSTEIQPGAKIIGPAVIGANNVIESGAVINECITEDYTRIGGIANLEKVIVFGDRCIDPSGTSTEIEAADIGWLIDDARKQFELSDEHKPLYEMIKELETNK